MEMIPGLACEPTMNSPQGTDGIIYGMPQNLVTLNEATPKGGEITYDMFVTPTEHSYAFRTVPPKYRWGCKWQFRIPRPLVIDIIPMVKPCIR